MRRPGRLLWGYVGILTLSVVIALVAGFTPLGGQIDNDLYDWMFRLKKAAPWQSQSALLEIDEASFAAMGGVRSLRSIVSDALERLAPVSPRVVVLDLTLTDAGDPAEDARLELAMSRTSKLVLAAEMMPGGEAWQQPLPRFRKWAAAVGHVHAAQDELDGINRKVPMEKVAGRERLWALSLEAFRLSRQAASIVESPEDLQVGGEAIPAARSDARAVWVRRLGSRPDGSTGIPHVSVLRLHEDPAAAELLRGKVVFIGVTAQSAARDRLMTPYSSEQPMPGVEIHANMFETLAQGRFMVAAGDSATLLASVVLTVLAGAAFWFAGGWTAYLLGGMLLAAATALPFAAFSRDLILPLTGPVSAAWLSVAAAASYQHFAARRQLRRAEAEKARYQQAVHFVTHEMRTPLTAIQGSSELMTRYSLKEDKRQQIAGLIHSESRRLGRRIETFLNVERLSAGQMELKREPVAVAEVVNACVERARPLAERKQITVETPQVQEASVSGDRELLEYAVYNLLTNAIKYSPPGTQVVIEGRRREGRYSLAVRDQGIGMDKKELRDIFRKFYRTKKAVASGETGTGIGLSIVEQIVTHHGGRIEVSSAPGKGSCFTIAVPVSDSNGAQDA